MILRWFELGWVDKGVAVIGLSIGTLGIPFAAFLCAYLATQGFSIQAGSGFDITALVIVGILSTLFFLPLLSALCLILLPLKDEQRGILSFVSLIVSIFTALPIYYILFALHCSATHSTCS